MLEPFVLLFDDDVRPQASLPEAIRNFYGGDWHQPEFNDRPYCFSNFAISRDGRVSFNEPGHLGGADVSGFNTHDRWLMALLRARADAVLVGDVTLEIEPEHLWTCDYIYPDSSAVLAEMRKAEGRKARPLQVFLSLEGKFDENASVFAQKDLSILIATTKRGFERAKDLQGAAQIGVVTLGEQRVDLTRLCQLLKADFGVNHLLCEGGPRVYGGFVSEALIDDEFLALCPSVIGNDRNLSGKTRPGLIEGAAFMPERYPKSIPVSMRRAGQHLFLRSRYSYE